MHDPTPAAASGIRRRERRWQDVSGAWLGIGTSPGALLIGAGLAARYGGPIPLLSAVLSGVLMFAILWVQGSLGLQPPLGDGEDLNTITQRYFDPLTQKLIGGLIAIGMIGWFGFNTGLGGAALSALTHIPPWTGPLILGIPVLAVTLKGLRIWNRLATVTTLAVLLLVVLVADRLAATELPLRLAKGKPGELVMDIAAFIGYISVFSVRAPDFSAGLTSRKDLAIVATLLSLPVVAIALAGVALQMGTGSTDLVGILAAPGGLALGNLLITIAVIAPTFTTLYSGAPALRAAIGLSQRTGMVLISVLGIGLAILRFDLQIIAWVAVLAAMLPPLVIPLAVEAARRRHGSAHQRVPAWVWLPGSLVSMGMTIARSPLALLLGVSAAATLTLVWALRSHTQSHQTSEE